MKTKEALKRLSSLADPEYLVRNERFACPVKGSIGVSLPNLRKLAKEIGKSHELALELWQQPIRDAKQLAALIDEPEKVTEEQMDIWVEDFDSWGLCDITTTDLFDQTAFAYKKAIEWAGRNEEFVKRAAFSLMAGLAVHDKEMLDEKFVEFLKIIKRESVDERNFVKKAVNWALRNIGKMRNRGLYEKAIQTAEEIQKTGSRPGRWIAADALRELKSEPIKERIEKLE